MLHSFLHFLIPKEGKFFEIFNAHANLMLDASAELLALMEKFSSGNSEESRRNKIQEYERSADELIHSMIDLLHHTLVTPFDRDQIHKLISSMDDVVDLIEDVAVTIFLYDVESLPRQAFQLSDLCQQACVHINSIIGMLSDLKNATEILNACKKIDDLESQADHIAREALSILFREEDNVKTLIKHKTILELLEAITDSCEDVANIVESIVLENI